MKRTLLILASIAFSAATFAQDNPPKEEFKPSGKIWGYAFGDYYTKLHADSLNRGNAQYSNVPKDMNAFDLRRVYLGYDYNISEKFSTELLVSHEGQTLGDGTRTLFLKVADVRWKNIFKNTDLVVGQQPTLAFPMLTEKIWGYRSIEKTVFDMRKGAVSSDLGISLQGRFDDAGNYGYNLMVANGTGQKFETDVYKKYYGDVWAKFMGQRIILDLYGDHESVRLLPGFHKAKTSFKFFAAYQSEALTVGLEAYQQMQKAYVVVGDSITDPKADTSDATVMGVSVWVRGMIIKEKLNFFARYDMYNPDVKFDANKFYFTGGAPVTENFITAGLDYTPHKNVHIMPNIWYNGYSNRTKNAKGLTKSDNDLVARITFWYIFK
ncbi:MAG TPA: hypothetical protein VI112_17720 [Bacteroidia bacterium]|jgi:hypothetical protein